MFLLNVYFRQIINVPYKSVLRLFSIILWYVICILYDKTLLLFMCPTLFNRQFSRQSTRCLVREACPPVLSEGQ